jgi:hypothetical protein
MLIFHELTEYVCDIMQMPLDIIKISQMLSICGIIMEMITNKFGLCRGYEKHWKKYIINIYIWIYMVVFLHK